MVKVKEIPVGDLKKYGLPYAGLGEVELISCKYEDRTRWSIEYELVFKWIDGKFYRTYYSIGATEMQDESPWEYDNYVECVEVRKEQRLVDVWVDVD